jgi:signal transduction histidine kinase
MLNSVRALETEIGNQTTMAAHRLANDLHDAITDDINRRFHRSLNKILELVPNITRVDVYIKDGADLRLLLSNSLPDERVLEFFELNALKSGQADTYMIEDEENGKRQIAAVYPIALLGGKPGLVTVISSLKSVSDLVTIHSRTQIYILSATILVLALGITILFRTTVYRSVHHLVNTMHLFQTGKTSVRAHEKLPGEFGELACHLNQMLKEISQFHENMKQQIQAATEALAKRNQELEGLNLLLIETQKRLTQSERLALIGQLTATFAHEIGSPLSAVSTHLQILLEDSKLHPAMLQRLKLADTEINRVCSIVENLLADIRRPDYRIAVDLCKTVENAAHLLGPTFQSRQIHFQLNCSATHAPVQGNPDQLQQLLLNLFNNAMDAISGAGSILIEIQSHIPEPPDSQRFWQIRIQDTGVGISHDKLEHIFEPFFTTKEFGKGTGLGLAVCQEIIRRHGGRISAESQPQHGTTFIVLLPQSHFPASEPIQQEIV